MATAATGWFSGLIIIDFHHFFMNTTSLQPHTKRILSLDVLRGVAVLGIIIMNIQSFSMISAAYINPTAYGDLTGINKAVWVWSHLMADQKFLSIFSILFGAGILLFSEHVKEKGYLPARFYYRRLFWLFTFGLIHGYLIWHGDILVIYAVAGAIAFLFRKLDSWVLFALGMVIFIVPAFNYWLFGKSMEYWPPEAIDAIRQTWQPGHEAVEREIAALTGSFGEQLNWRIPEAFKMQTFLLVIYLGWRVLAMMLIGMGLYKTGALSGNLSKKGYFLMAVISLAIGYLLIWQGIVKNFESGWSVEYSMFIGWQWNYFGSLPVALGYIAVVMLLLSRFRMTLLALAGRMALTNYILTSVICSIIFYGHGFGLFGAVTRVQQLLTVMGLWVFLLLFSRVWFRYFYYGPLEWLWRFLTYGNKPVFKR